MIASRLSASVPDDAPEAHEAQAPQTREVPLRRVAVDGHADEHRGGDAEREGDRRGRVDEEDDAKPEAVHGAEEEVDAVGDGHREHGQRAVESEQDAEGSDQDNEHLDAAALEEGDALRRRAARDRGEGADGEAGAEQPEDADEVAPLLDPERPGRDRLRHAADAT